MEREYEQYDPPLYHLLKYAKDNLAHHAAFLLEADCQIECESTRALNKLFCRDENIFVSNLQSFSDWNSLSWNDQAGQELLLYAFTMNLTGTVLILSDYMSPLSCVWLAVK